jgi:hypothetical protein
LCPILALTAHWLGREEPGSNLILKTALFTFHNVTGKYDGENLAKISVRLMDHAGMTANVSLCHCSIIYLFIQVGHFTLDNAANNETWMKELETILLARLIGQTIASCIYLCTFSSILH